MAITSSCMTLSYMMHSNLRTAKKNLISEKYVIIMLLLPLCYINLSDGQVCTDTVNVQQRGFTIDTNRLAIIPRLNFTCNGRITSIRARVFLSGGNGLLSFQVWQLASVDSRVYNKTGETRLQSDDQVIRGVSDLLEANIILTGTNRMEFQSGDVVGFYHPPQSRYRLLTIPTNEYRLYQRVGSSDLVSLVGEGENNRQLLIQFTVDIRCDDLSAPANGEILSCSSGRLGVGYEGDTCSFTCNTGYELTGSDTRTCQSDGSWSGTDNVCRRVQCTNLLSPTNGNISCDSTDVSHYEDQCLFSCDPGYELTGSSSRQCLSNGSWSGSDVTCDVLHCDNLTDTINNSVLANDCGIPCVSLSDPKNGNVTCPSNTSVFQDTCTYYCNRGYQLEGNRRTRCDADGTWSSEPVTCTILKCSDPEVEIANSQSVGACNVTYGSSCSLNCSSGFSASGNGEHVCDDVNDEGTSVKWRSVGGAFTCAVAGNFGDSGDESTITVITGSVGGAAFIIIVILLSFVMLCYVKHFHKKRSLSFNNEAVIELNSDVKMNNNPSYNIVAQNKKQEDKYDYVLHSKISPQDVTLDTINMESNPSYGRVQGCNTLDYDATAQTISTDNSLLKETAMMSEDDDQNGFVETKLCNVQGADYLELVASATEEGGQLYDAATNDINDVEFTPNPSYDTVSKVV